MIVYDVWVFSIYLNVLDIRTKSIFITTGMKMQFGWEKWPIFLCFPEMILAHYVSFCYHQFWAFAILYLKYE